MVDAADALAVRRGETRRELWFTLGASTIASVALALETWGVVAGEGPLLGWLIPALFTAFAIHFGRRFTAARRDVASLEMRVQRARIELAEPDSTLDDPATGTD